MAGATATPPRRSARNTAAETLSAPIKLDPSPSKDVKKPRKRKSEASVSADTSLSVKTEEAISTVKLEAVVPVQEVDTKVVPAKRRKVKAEEDEKPAETFPPRASTSGRSSHYVGAHISSAGGVENAPLNALRIGSNAFSCFVRPKMQWASKPIPDPSIDGFRMLVAQHGYADYAVPHGCYLVNLANPDEEKREKSYGAFLDDVQRCQALGVKLYNFHPGSTTGTITKEEGARYVAHYINRVLAETQDVTILVENMAGRRGNILGGDLMELRCIIDNVEDKSRIGVCIDTCHAFAAGYDFRTRETYEAFVTQLDSELGLEYVKAMHLNDSKFGLDENKDRHENLGAGHLGLWPFYALMNDSRFAGIPLILETPGGQDDVMHSVWSREVAALYMLQGRAEDESDWQPVRELLQQVQTIRNVSKAKLEVTKAAKKAKAVGKVSKSKIKKDSDNDQSDDE